ncbi:MAG: protein kinase domain-containing protein [Myxococcaceae bacterium]
MSGERDGQTDGAQNAHASSIIAKPGTAPRRTPDQPTLLLPTLDGSGPGSRAESDSLTSSQERDVPRLSAGESLAGRFTILRLIAQGGMGAVYEASDAMLRSVVALKVIRGRIAIDATAMERFRREVLLARRVSHPNVCRVYELYEATTGTGVPIHFLTMEFLEGETLRERIARQGRMTTAEALPLVRQLCEGLAAAHAEGVIHRDFKSSNVMLASRGKGPDDSTAPSTRAAITDFGIALAAQLGKGESSDGPLTGGAAILGTPEYMAPEQVTGGTVTQATDIYAFGVVLYEMLTGRLPFTGDTPLVAAAKRLSEAPPRPEVTTPGLDARWSATVLRCLAREPERRFKSALDILPALVQPARRWPRWTVISAVTLALGLAAFAAMRVFPKLRRAEPPRTAVPVAPRPVLAILGFRDELASPKLAWLTTAISETLGHELAAAETSLRVIPGDRVASVRGSLGVSEESVTEDKARERMQGLLAANVLVYGTLKPIAHGSAAVGLIVEMVDARWGRVLASFEEHLGEGADGLAEKLSTVAERLRRTLGVSLSDEQAAALSASRELNVEAIRSYTQGVLSLRKFEYTSAKSDFDAALATDGSFLAAQRRVVELWEHEGNRKKAREVAERIHSRPNALTPRQLAELDAQLLSLGSEPRKGTDARRALFDATPDDVELGLSLIEFDRFRAPKVARAFVNRMRHLPAPASGDIRIELAEAHIAGLLGDRQRSEELLTRANIRAQALGARTEMALALYVKAFTLDGVEVHPADAIEPLRRAEALLSTVGDLDEFARAKAFEAQTAIDLPPVTAALKTLEYNAALYRKLGEHSHLSITLEMEAGQLVQSGDFDLAASKLREVSAELETLGEVGGPGLQGIKGSLALNLADMEGVRDAVRLLRTVPNGESDADYAASLLPLEGNALEEQDRLREARAVWERQLTSWETIGQGAFVDRLRSHLCFSSCLEGHPLEGLSCLARLPLDTLSGSVGPVYIKIYFTVCRYLAGDLRGAEEAAAQAQAASQTWGLYNERIISNAYLMRAKAARGESRRAIATLRADLAEAERRKAKMVAFEVALALGEVEVGAGRPEGHSRLLRLEQEAKSKEFFHIARLAREAFDGKPAAAAQKHVERSIR